VSPVVRIVNMVVSLALKHLLNALNAMGIYSSIPHPPSTFTHHPTHLMMTCWGFFFQWAIYQCDWEE
jgi:hypothetical protein